MSEILKVEHFGPIRNAELELKKTTVLIGPQGSGKSTLAKLVGILKDPNIFLMDISENITKKFLEFSLPYFSPLKTKIQYSNKSYGVFSHNKAFSFEFYESYKSRNDIQKLLQEADLSELELFFIEQKTKNNEFSENDRLKLKEYRYALEKRLPSAKYLPAERFFISSTSGAQWGLIYNNISLSPFISAFGNDFEIARGNIKNLDISFLNVEYRYEGGVDKVYHNNNDFVKLAESASGHQAVIPIMLVVENLWEKKAVGYHFIVDEPELNLYPTTQKDLVYYLANRCTKGENELLMTTHSPYVLSALNNLLFAYQVAQKHPDKEEEIGKIIPKESWLNPAEFAAYYVGDGTVRSIVNPKTGMISENELDTASELIGEEFDNLMDIYRTPLHAHTNS